MPAPYDEPSVRIHGAGPAGAVLALRVRAAGFPVALVHGPPGGRRVPEETVLATATPRLARHGLLEFIRAEQALGTVRHGILWDSPEIHWRTETAESRGYKIARAAFDEWLRQRAREAGIAVQPRRAARPAAGALEVLASGKHLAGISPGPRTLHCTAETLALGALRSGHSEFGDVTLIEAVPEGWWWWLPLHDGRIAVTLFADGEEVRERGPAAVWRSARGNALGPARAAPEAHEYGTPATPRARVHDQLLLAGDAASTIDPLSSQGLEKALASAEQAARCVVSLLEHPDEAAGLMAWHRSWEERLFLAHARRTTSLYRRETRFETAPFWKRRRLLPAAMRGPEAPPRDRALARHPRLSRATGYREDGLRLARFTGWGIPGGGPVIDRVGDVPLDALLGLLDEAATAEEIGRRAGEEPALFLFSPGVIRQAIEELYRLGLVVEARRAPASP